MLKTKNARKSMQEVVERWSEKVGKGQKRSEKVGKGRKRYSKLTAPINLYILKCQFICRLRFRRGNRFIAAAHGNILEYFL